MTVRPTAQGTTFNMRGQVCRGHTNATAFVQQSGGQCTGLRVGRPGFSWPGQGVVPLRRAGKKMRAPLLGLAKSICYHGMTLTCMAKTDIMTSLVWQKLQ